MAAKHRGKPGSKGTLWEFLNKPMGMDSILEVLDRDIQFGNKGNNPHVMPNLESQAEQLISRAEAMAARKGISIEEALSQFGVDLNDSGQGQGEAKTQMRDSMLRSLEWEVTRQESNSYAPEKSWIRRSDDAKEAIHAALGEVDMESIDEILDSLLPTDALFRERLVFLGFCNVNEYDQAARQFKQSGGFFWQWLLQDEGRDVELFATVLKTMPFSPIFAEDNGSFCEWLLNQGHLIYYAFKQARIEAKAEGMSVCRFLKSDKIFGQSKYMTYLSDFSGLAQHIKTLPKVTVKLSKALGIKWVELFDIAPLAVTKDGLTLGLSSPLPESILDLIAKETKKKIKPVLISDEAVASMRDAILEKHEASIPVSKDQDSPKGRIRDIVASASAVNMVRQLFEGALDSRATDIHIEPLDGKTRVRFRIDGMLYEVVSMEAELANEVVSRIKILADLDITERRRPQDGHIRIGIRDQEFDMRIATVPTKHGEKIGIRLVYSGRVLKSLSELGLHKDDDVKVKRFIEMPHGMILATGPVGSGKSTTLYSCLNEIDRVSHNVMSVEDPVEFGLMGANQVEVNYKLQFGFVEGLRALLRQDPDTILIGEIRDEETARIAVRASMTGLLVFSTLHTNDAPGAITTLYNFNLPTHLIANSLVGVIAQRLLRKICENCKTSYKPTKKELTMLGLKPAQQTKVKKLYRGKGCSQCFHTGYYDRYGVYEVMEISDNIRNMIIDKASEKEIREMAIKEKMCTLAVDGQRKVLSGNTTVEELRRVLRI